MKIVDVCEFYAERGGGVKTYVHQKLRAAAQAGHEMVVIAPGPQDQEQALLGGRVVWVKGPPLPPDPRYYVLYRERAVHAILDRERPDVVEGSSPWTGGWFAARWRGSAKRAFVYHQDPVAVYPQSLLSPPLSEQQVDRACAGFWSYLAGLSGRFDVTVTSGDWLAQRLAGRGLKHPVAVPFGVDRGAFGPQLRDEGCKRAWLQACGAPEDAALVITVSRHHPEKRLSTVIEAIARASRERPIAWVLFGDGPLRRYIEFRARRLPHAHIAGAVGRQELATAMASADAMVHGSAAETYGLVVAEALCSGLPVVVPDRGGALDFADGPHATVYATGDPQACAQALGQVLSEPRARLRQAALEGAERRVGTMESHFAQLFKRYAELCAQ